MGSEELKQAIRTLSRVPKVSTGENAKAVVSMAPACAFGAVMEQRLKDIEASLTELKTRLNGLIFLIVGAVLVEIVMRLVK